MARCCGASPDEGQTEVTAPTELEVVRDMARQSSTPARAAQVRTSASPPPAPHRALRSRPSGMGRAPGDRGLKPAGRFREATRHLLTPQGPTAPPADRPSFEVDAAAWIEALTTVAGLVEVESVLIQWTARFDPARVRACHASLISVRRRPSEEREQLLDELERIAADTFGGTVDRPFLTALYTGRRP